MKIEKKRISISDTVNLKKSFCRQRLNTVCQSAKCPNIGECFKKRTATFLILGKNCTRSCGFCGIDKKTPETPDPGEPERIAKAVKELGLKYVVITSVTRDDLQDGGAGHFAAAIKKIAKINPESKIEVLVPDFQGKKSGIDAVLEAKPDVFAHNLETVPSLYAKVRRGADYKRSLEILRYAKNKGFKVKTGIMLGLGEKEEEVFMTIKDIKETGADILTVGQYLAPSIMHYPVIYEYSDDEFARIKDYAVSAGIKNTVCGRYVRSSYLAEEQFRKAV